ncbi:hypothetical protein J4Q44_G00245340 [Coregonus suidteri]|uniref:Uncharacterized protein n=1 Tax=Coregonus suidteri TaxID=861788 RepID=A0AAN8L3U0_9TELE
MDGWLPDSFSLLHSIEISSYVIVMYSHFINRYFIGRYLHSRGECVWFNVKDTQGDKWLIVIILFCLFSRRLFHLERGEYHLKIMPLLNVFHDEMECWFMLYNVTYNRQEVYCKLARRGSPSCCIGYK